MIEALEKLAVADCLNCGHPISLFRGEWTALTWYHENQDGSGERWCQGAPLATPRDGTVVEKPSRV